MKFPSVYCCLLLSTVHAITVSVSNSGGKAASPLQYGLMFEDINHSGDGGIYAELIQNRAFQSGSSISPWTTVGGATLAVGSSSPPLSGALPRSVKISGAQGRDIGISNPGYWGIEVKPQNYTGSFYVLGDYSGSFTARLQSASGGTVFATVDIPSQSKAGAWTKHTFSLRPTSAAPDTKNVFTLTFKPTDGSQSLNFNLISLFPPTFNGRPNGMRIDLMDALKGLNPSFFRIPGGNNLEGEKAGQSWKWNATIGDLTQRPGRQGDWGYYNTDGLGLIEYMHWCQDLDVEPILAVWSGLYLDKTVLSKSALQPYVQDALNELEFLMGDASTTYGKQRIALGYTEPFNIKYVEVGNEDHLNNGLSSYNSYRFSMFHDAIMAKYPQMIVISSTSSWNPKPGNSAGDYHQYDTPDIFAGEFGEFDSSSTASTAHKILVGEYAVIQANIRKNTAVDWKSRIDFPSWIGTVAEAIFQLGGEKNTDKMIGFSYAPLLENLNSVQWKPDLIAFNADSSQTTLSTSYQQTKLFSSNRFTTVLPSTNSEKYNPAYWVTGINADTNTYIFKAAVYNTTSAVPFDLSFPGVASGATAQLTVLTTPSGPLAMQRPGSANVVKTDISTITATGNGFSFSLPQWSIAVLTTKASGAMRSMAVSLEG